MRQVLRTGALGRPRGMGWRGRQEGGSGWGTHVNPWLIHVNVWQKPLQYCKVISLQLIKINEKKKIYQRLLSIGPTRNWWPYHYYLFFSPQVQWIRFGHSPNFSNFRITYMMELKSTTSCDSLLLNQNVKLDLSRDEEMKNN